MKGKRQDIYLPHIHYTVRIRQAVKPPAEISNALAWVQSDDDHSCTLFLDLKKTIGPGDLAHELIHVLQRICLARDIDFRLEQEHMGYIMHYLMGRVLGQSFEEV